MHLHPITRLLAAVLVASPTAWSAVPVEKLQSPSDLKRACERGDAAACMQLGDGMADVGFGSADLGKARNYYRSACSTGAQRACMYHGLMRMYGLGGDKDEAGGEAQVQQACDSGIKEACRFIKEEATPEVDARLRRMFEKTCKADDADSCLIVSLLALWGVGGDADQVLARERSEQACQLGLPFGCSIYGEMLLEGLGGPADRPRARELLESACSNGEEQYGCALLGRMLRHGFGGSRAPGRARSCFKRSCEAGGALACVWSLLDQDEHPMSTEEQDLLLQKIADGCKAGDDDACLARDAAFVLTDIRPGESASAISRLEGRCAAAELHACRILLPTAKDTCFKGDEAACEQMRGLLDRTCQFGDPAVCALHGIFLLEGIGGPVKEELGRKILSDACNQNIAEGCWMLGAWLIDSGSRPDDDSQGIHVLEHGCEAGFVLACSAAGIRLAVGQGVPKNVARAHSLLGRACTNGDGAACNQLSVMSARGDGCERDDRAAREYSERACELGSNWGCVRFASSIGHGIGGAAEPERALKLAERLCTGGELPAACALLARLLLTAKGVETDPERAAELLDQDCELGSAASCLLLADVVSAGKTGPRNWARAGALRRKGMHALNRQCAAGVAGTCEMVSELILKQQVARSDLQQASLQLARTCDGGGVGEACVEVARLFEIGTSVPKNTAMAIKMYDRTCTIGLAKACGRLGDIYFQGDGAAHNSRRARKYYERACNLGSGQHCYDLALMQQYGHGARPNAQAARNSHETACELGFWAGCYQAGSTWEDGGKPDPSKALQLLTRGCNGGHASACRALYEWITADGTKNAEEGTKFLEDACNRKLDWTCYKLEELKKTQEAKEGAPSE